jgi:hypothetical protein
VEIVPDISSLCKKVDGVLLLSVDGRVHLEQFRQIVAARKPVFIDKPLAASFKDAKEMARIAKEAGVPWFSSSSARYSEPVLKATYPDIKGAIVWGPGPLDPTHELDLSWYAIHPIEMLFSILGPGCVEVSRIHSESADVLTGRWKDGRIGTVRAMRTSGGYGADVFREKQVERSTGAGGSYPGLLKEMIRFFQTGKPPFPNEYTLEIFSFMDAAMRSKEAGGKPVRLEK